MNKALDLFTATPKLHNCAQSVACGVGREELFDALSGCGGGKAPDGFCGALFAAMVIAGPDHRDEVAEKFCSRLGAVRCAELKRELHIPCADCVACGAALAEEYAPPKN